MSENLPEEIINFDKLSIFPDECNCSKDEKKNPELFTFQCNECYKTLMMDLTEYEAKLQHGEQLFEQITADYEEKIRKLEYSLYDLIATKPKKVKKVKKKSL